MSKQLQKSIDASIKNLVNIRGTFNAINYDLPRAKSTAGVERIEARVVTAVKNLREAATRLENAFRPMTNDRFSALQRVESEAESKKAARDEAKAAKKEQQRKDAKAKVAKKAAKAKGVKPKKTQQGVFPPSAAWPHPAESTAASVPAVKAAKKSKPAPNEKKDKVVKAVAPVVSSAAAAEDIYQRSTLSGLASRSVDSSDGAAY